jgi:pimeloyl-ACP methyl ester carboxylesterase
MARGAHIVHGFNVDDGGAKTTNLLMPHLKQAGFRILDHDYGWFGLVQVRLCNGGIAETVRAATRRGDIGIGHSNGCAILMEAAQRGAQFTGLVLINPALDEDCKAPAQVRWIHVYHNREDSPVKWSRILLLHPWGAMGRHGYRGKDERYTNFDCYPEVQGHSDIFKKLDRWGPRIVKNIGKALKPPVKRAA